MMQTSMSSMSSSPSSSFQKMSKTSSAGGDWHAVSRGLNKLANVPVSKFKLQSTKAKRPRRTKKITKPSNSFKATFGSLRNAVVLAPFHSLKKCFQTKLVDFYSRQKTKKTKHAIKKGNKKNLCFEYDVMEVNTLNTNAVKKDKKVSKGQKKKDAQMEKKTKRSKNFGPICYCNCRENKLKEENKKIQKSMSNEPKKVKQTRRSSTRNSRELSSADGSQMPSSSSGELECKRRRMCVCNTGNSLNHPSSSGVLESKKKKDLLDMVCNAQKPQISMTLRGRNSNDYISSARRSGTNWSISGISNHSKFDSWETYSDSLSVSEEPREDSLAMSTTSTGSCMNRSDRDVSRCAGDLRKKEQNKKNRKRGGFARDFSSTTKDYNPRQLMRFETNNSDEQIADFMDREPQSLIKDGTSPLLPLRRKSKTKKQENANIVFSSYYLRSVNALSDQIQPSADKECAPDDLASEAVGNRCLVIGSNLQQNVGKKPSKNAVVEPAKESESNAQETEKRIVASPRKNIENLTTNISSTNDEVLHSTSFTHSQPVIPGKSSIEINKAGNSCETLQESEVTVTVNESSNQIQNSGSLETIDNAVYVIRNKSRLENVSLEQKGTSESPDSAVLHAEEIKDKNKGHDGSEFPKAFWNKEMETLEPVVVLDEHPDQSSVSLLPRMEEYYWYEESSDKNGQSEETESNYIFGQRRASDGLGDSCELSFGLNWVLSDDEESNHKENFF